MLARSGSESPDTPPPTLVFSRAINNCSSLKFSQLTEWCLKLGTSAFHSRCLKSPSRGNYTELKMFSKKSEIYLAHPMFDQPTKTGKSPVQTFPVDNPGLGPTERAGPSDSPLQRFFDQTPSGRPRGEMEERARAEKSDSPQTVIY